MRTLAIETATEACSIALFEGSDMVLLDYRHETIGRGHQEKLVPMIAGLPDKGRASRILVSLGPGSFTGVRIGLAAARALGIAWRAEVLGYPTLALVAAAAGEDTVAPLTICMHAGHGQFFLQNFDSDRQPEDQIRSLTPEEAKQGTRHHFICGNRASQLASLFADNRVSREILPDARKTGLLSADQFIQDLVPLYGRDPDAKLPV